jgi:hypothetical protein
VVLLFLQRFQYLLIQLSEVIAALEVIEVRGFNDETDLQFDNVQCTIYLDI